MSNNDDMEVDVDRGHGLQCMDDKNKRHEARGNKAGTRDVNEKEREQVHREKGKKPDKHNRQTRHSNDENNEDWIPIGNNNKQNKHKDDMAQDGMTSYHIKTGVIEVRFMKIGDKGFNFAKSLKEFIAAARESDKEFSIMTIHNKGDNLCRATDVPNTKEGIGKYYRHVIKFNNINGSTWIRTSMDIGKLKQADSAFHIYLQAKRVYINKAQLGT
jgi:hypothetical protein